MRVKRLVLQFKLDLSQSRIFGGKFTSSNLMRQRFPFFTSSPNRISSVSSRTLCCIVYATFALNTQICQVRCFVLDFATLKLTLRLEHCFNPFSVWMPKKQIFKYLKCVHYRITVFPIDNQVTVLLHAKEVCPILRLVKSDYKSGVQFHMYLELNRTIVQSHGSRFRLKSNQAWVGLVPRISRLLIKNKYSKMCIE